MLLSSAYIKPRTFQLLVPPCQQELGMHKELRGGRTRTAGPNWPKGYCIARHAMLNNTCRVGRREGSAATAQGPAGIGRCVVCWALLVLDRYMYIATHVHMYIFIIIISTSSRTAARSPAVPRPHEVAAGTHGRSREQRPGQPAPSMGLYDTWIGWAPTGGVLPGVPPRAGFLSQHPQKGQSSEGSPITHG